MDDVCMLGEREGKAPIETAFHTSFRGSPIPGFENAFLP
jgi:hypothetical protein